MKFIATLRDYIWIFPKIFISMFIYFCLYSWLASSQFFCGLEWNLFWNHDRQVPSSDLENCCLHHPGLRISWAHRHALTPTCLICKADVWVHISVLLGNLGSPKPHSLLGTYLVLVRDLFCTSALLFVSGGGSTKWSELLITQLLSSR